jgi:endonuclease YncB( thermonuclease family)
VRAGQTFSAVVLRVVDGDTLIARVDCACAGISVDVRVRLVGVYAPELPTSDGKIAFERLRAALEGKSVRLVFHKFDRYGRWLCDVSVSV